MSKKSDKKTDTGETGFPDDNMSKGIDMPLVEKTQAKVEPPKTPDKRTLRVLMKSFETSLGKNIVFGAVHDHLDGHKLIEIGEDHQRHPIYEVDGMDSIVMTTTEFVSMVNDWKNRPAY